MFKKYRRSNLAEIRDLRMGESKEDLELNMVSISSEDDKLPINEFLQGKVARNPKNIKDQWYIAKKYFDENFVPVERDVNEQKAEINLQLNYLETLKDIYNSDDMVEMQTKIEIYSENIDSCLLNKYKHKSNFSLLSL